MATKEYSNLSPFRYWCYHVIPLVYDDSLSYYELLCKVVYYLNSMIGDNKKMIEAIEELKAYVDNYFDNLDVTQMINNKLDEMASNGTLDEIINQHIFGEIQHNLTNLNSTVHYYFIGGNASQPCGESMIMDLGDGSCFIFDFGNQYSANYIRSILNDHNITTIKGVVLSHYHPDHIGGTNFTSMSTIIEGFTVAENAKAYLPHNNIELGNWVGDGGWIHDASLAISEYLDSQGFDVVYPEEDDVVIINEATKFVFNNLSRSKFSYYYNYTLDSTGADAGTTTYNNFSMITTVWHFNHKLIYTGDIHEPAEGQNVSVAQGADIFVVEHHGLNRPVNEDWVTAITPEIAVICTGDSYHEVDYYAKTDIYKLLAGCEQVVITAHSGTVEIADDISGFTCKTALGQNLNMMYAFSGLSYGVMMLGNGYNLNELVTPGEYCAQSAPQAQLVANAPWTNSGFKLSVIQASPSLPIIQVAIANTSKANRIAIRRRDSDVNKTWGSWKYLQASPFYDLVDSELVFSDGVTINDSGEPYNRNYVLLQNGFLSVGLDINLSRSFNAGEDILNIPCNAYGRGALFELVNYANTATRYWARLAYDSTANPPKYVVEPNGTIPAGRYIGNIVVPVNPNSL